MLEELLTGHKSGVAGAHSGMFYLHLVERACVQSAFACSHRQQNDLVSSVQFA